MRWAAVLLLALVPAAAAGQAVECLSIDGQLRVDFQDGAVSGVNVRVPADGAREVRLMRLFPSDLVLEVLSETPPRLTTEGCAGAEKGTIAIVKTTTITTRRLRLRLREGGAFPPGVGGRSADGDVVERDMTCTSSTSAMAACP